MSGIKDLNEIMKEMTPILNEELCVFASVENWEGIDHTKVIGSFVEKEGITLILNAQEAVKLQLSYENTYSWITLNVHSSLEAVGFTAAFSAALGSGNISCNVIAGFYHDHIFIKKEDAIKAMEILNNLSNPN